MSAPIDLKVRDFKYRAFLSYAHADLKTGKWLHGQLEGFRIDKDLVGRVTAIGSVPKALRPIFRDREDFSGGHTLTDATLAALEASAALIVLCSRVSATRPAVNEEVRLFRWRHPDRPVIPVILDGTPYSSSPRASTGRSDASIPPSPSSRGEGRGEAMNPPSPSSRGEGRGEAMNPLSPSSRGEGQGEGRPQAPTPPHATLNAGLRLAAAHPNPLPIAEGQWGEGIHTAPDECFPLALRFEINTDGTISDRPVIFLAPDLRDSGDGKQLALAKIVAGLTGVGTDEIFKRARRAARRQAWVRGTVAASLIALAGVGGYLTLENRQQGTVIATKDKVIADKDAREKKIAAIVARERAKLPAGASTSPGQEQDLTAALEQIFAAADDGDATAARIADLLSAGKTEEAIDVRVAAEEARERRAANEFKRAAKGYREAAALAATAQPARARDLYARAAKLDGDDVEGLFQHGWFQQEAGNLGAAETAYRQVLAIGKPGENDYRLYWSRLGLGDIQIDRGDLPAAKATYGEAATIAQRRLDADPGNQGWQRDLSVSYDRVGDVLVAQGNLPEALKSFRDSLAIADKLAARDPGNQGWQRDLALSNGRVASILARQGAREEARAGYEKARDIIARLKAQSPDNARLPKDLAFYEARVRELE